VQSTETAETAVDLGKQLKTEGENILNYLQAEEQAAQQAQAAQVTEAAQPKAVPAPLKQDGWNGRSQAQIDEIFNASEATRAAERDARQAENARLMSKAETAETATEQQGKRETALKGFYQAEEQTTKQYNAQVAQQAINERFARWEKLHDQERDARQAENARLMSKAETAKSATEQQGRVQTALKGFYQAEEQTAKQLKAQEARAAQQILAERQQAALSELNNIVNTEFGDILSDPGGWSDNPDKMNADLNAIWQQAYSDPTWEPDNFSAFSTAERNAFEGARLTRKEDDAKSARIAESEARIAAERATGIAEMNLAQEMGIARTKADIENNLYQNYINSGAGASAKTGSQASAGRAGGGAAPKKDESFRQYKQQLQNNLIQELNISNSALDRIKQAIETTTWQIGEGIGFLYDNLVKNSIIPAGIAGTAAGTAFVLLLSLLVIL
jgi:chemotaxis protein histidine kinase CheA